MKKVQRQNIKTFRRTSSGLEYTLLMFYEEIIDKKLSRVRIRFWVRVSNSVYVVWCKKTIRPKKATLFFT